MIHSPASTSDGSVNFDPFPEREQLPAGCCGAGCRIWHLFSFLCRPSRRRIFIFFRFSASHTYCVATKAMRVASCAVSARLGVRLALDTPTCASSCAPFCPNPPRLPARWAHSWPYSLGSPRLSARVQRRSRGILASRLLGWVSNIRCGVRAATSNSNSGGHLRYLERAE